MKEEFRLGELSYVFRFENHELSLYVDISGARTQLHNGERQRDDFFGFDFYHLPNLEISKVANNVQAAKPVLLYKTGMRFVRHVMAVEKPYLLRFSANEPSKAKLYSRIALKISSESGYNLATVGSTYNLYRPSN